MSLHVPKSLLLFHFLIIFFAIRGSAQEPWTRVTPTPVERSINDMIHIPGTDRLIAVADRSTIMTSDDAGESWDISLYPGNLDHNYNLKTVCFIDNLTGFIGGRGYSILKTTDGGLNWSVKFGGEPDIFGDIIDLCFMNDTTGFAIGEFGLFLKSNDRGETWSELDTLDLQFPNKFQKIDENCAYISSNIPNTWFKTNDGGETWILENQSTTAPGDYMSDIWFFNDSTAVAAYNYSETFLRFYKTTDFGQTWDSICTPDWGIVEMYFDFWDDLHGMALCVSIAYYSTVMITDDGGNTWTQISEPLNWQYLNSTCYLNQQNILVAGFLGNIYKSTDCGSNWIKIDQRELGGKIFDIQFVNENIGYVSCYSIGDGVISKILKQTTDGGVTWHYIHHFAGTSSLPFFFFPQFTGYIAFGNELFWYNLGELDAISTGFDFEMLEIKFYNEMVGVITGTGKVIRTLDGGLTWNDITPLTNPGNEYKNIEFVSDQDIYITCTGKLFKSNNTGSTWQIIPFSTYTDIQDLFVSNDTVFILASPRILRSIDGSATWDTCQISSNGYIALRAIYFPSPNIGYAVGEGDYENIIKTTDGGATWSALEPYSSTPLSCVYFKDENNGLVFGDLGLEMKTETGGVVKVENFPTKEYNCNFYVNPNPFDKEISIGFKNQTTFPVYLTMTDMTGKMITQLRITDAGEVCISTDQLKAGCYIFEVGYKDGLRETRKVIKL